MLFKFENHCSEPVACVVNLGRQWGVGIRPSLIPNQFRNCKTRFQHVKENTSMSTNLNRLLCLSNAHWGIHVLLFQRMPQAPDWGIIEDGLSYPDYSNVQRLLGDGPRMAGAGGASLSLVGRPAWLVPVINLDPGMPDSCISCSLLLYQPSQVYIHRAHGHTGTSKNTFTQVRNSRPFPDKTLFLAPLQSTLPGLPVLSKEQL